MRRAFDITVASVGLLVVAPFMLLTAVLIKLSSAGPVFYGQERIGRFGKPFRFLKFRTMRVGDGGPAVTADGDDRITPVGTVLRAWKLDELPQLWNVLVGDMSLIGPRPEVGKFVRLYTPAQREILNARPGLASMSQLVYPQEPELLRGQPDPEAAYAMHLVPRKLAIDLAYEERRTFLSDLGVLCEIGLLVLGRRPRVDATFQIPPPRA